MGATLLLPVHPYLPVTLSAGGFAARTEAQGWQPGLGAELFWGSHGYNYDSLYALSAGVSLGAVRCRRLARCRCPRRGKARPELVAPAVRARLERDPRRRSGALKHAAVLTCPRWSEGRCFASRVKRTES
jgi:hypothetical protein